MNLELKLEEINFIIAAIHFMPKNQADGMIEKIKLQYEEQNKTGE